MKALASIFMGDDDACWLVTATPSEAAEVITEALRTESKFVRFTLGNESDWNGKSLLYLDPRSVSAVSPPKSQDEEDDE